MKFVNTRMGNRVGMIGIVALMALGVERIIFSDKQDFSEEQSSGLITGKHCACQCE